MLNILVAVTVLIWGTVFFDENGNGDWDWNESAVYESQFTSYIDFYDPSKPCNCTAMIGQTDELGEYIIAASLEEDKYVSLQGGAPDFEGNPRTTVDLVPVPDMDGHYFKVYRRDLPVTSIASPQKADTQSKVYLPIIGR